MGAINLPHIIANGDPLDADQVMADLQAITTVANGGLQANSNVAAAAAVSQIGAANAEGVAATLARSDHTHILQGVESGTADPTTGNFIGRLYFRTDLIKLKMCIATGGSGTWAVIANMAAADVPIHAAEHLTGGHDPLPNNIITAGMHASQAIFSATMSASVTSISTTSYTTLVDLAVTTTGIQTILVLVHVKSTNVHATNKPQVGIRVVDQTAGGTPTIFRSSPWGLAAAGSLDSLSMSFMFAYTTPAGGARTLRLAAGSDVLDVTMVKSTTFNSDAFVPAHLTAVVI